MRRSDGSWQNPGVDDPSFDSVRKKIKRVTRRLETRFGTPGRGRRKDPLETLVQTLLSQNTNDRNRDRAYQQLRTRFPRWEDVLNATPQAVIRAIRVGGLAGQKTKRLREILRWVKKREGKLSLASLKRMETEEIKGAFGNLKGIGPKTLHCLLLFGLGREAFPVDTHVLRVGKRLGFIPERSSAAKAHEWMSPLVPRGKSLSLHVNLIRFGRLVCRANRPQCQTCFLAQECACGLCRGVPPEARESAGGG